MTGNRPTVHFAHLGPTRHGVRRYGELLARVVSERVDSDPWAPVVHVQFSDHLVDVDAFERAVLALRSDRPGRCIVATFHDCPGVGHDDAGPDARRATSYTRAGDAVDAVVVCSDHERRALRGVGISDAITVIAHLVEDRQPRSRPSVEPRRPRVGVLGFVYPGKGHEEVIDACAGSERGPEMVVLGGPSSGHDGLAAELASRARSRRIDYQMTGWIDDDDLGGWLADIDVPVLAHHAPSASGSLATWLSAGRRPLVAASPYARELHELAPDAITLYDPTCGTAELTRVIDRAIDRPATTWGTGPPDALRAPAIVAAHLELYRSLS